MPAVIHSLQAMSGDRFGHCGSRSPPKSASPALPPSTTAHSIPRGAVAGAGHGRHTDAGARKPPRELGDPAAATRTSPVVGQFADSARKVEVQQQRDCSGCPEARLGPRETASLDSRGAVNKLGTSMPWSNGGCRGHSCLTGMHRAAKGCSSVRTRCGCSRGASRLCIIAGRPTPRCSRQSLPRLSGVAAQAGPPCRHLRPSTTLKLASRVARSGWARRRKPNTAEDKRGLQGTLVPNSFGGSRAATSNEPRGPPARPARRRGDGRNRLFEALVADYRPDPRRSLTRPSCRSLETGVAPNQRSRTAFIRPSPESVRTVLPPARRSVPFEGA